MKEDVTVVGTGKEKKDRVLAMNRRDFLKAAGGGIIILFSATVLPAQERRWIRQAAGTELPQDFNAFLKVGADGRVSCFTGKIEMGQGIVTSLAQMLADELDVPVDRVDMVMGDTDLCPYDMGTFGSRSTRFFGPPLREAAAMARAVLLDLAAEHLKLPKEQLVVKDGLVSDKKDGRRTVTYQQLTMGKYIERKITGKAPVKDVKELKVMGRALRRTDGVRKATGEARYAGDIVLPGMLYARILRPPVHGARLKHIDTSGIKNDPEIRLVQEAYLVAVLHPHPDVAEQALSRIKAEFDLPESNLDNKTIFDHLLKKAPGEGEVISEGGDLKEGEKSAAKIFDETYFDHYVAHAAIETHTATVKIENDKVTVWPSTQRPFATKDDVAGALGVSPSRVRVIMPFVGGGFGGKSNTQQSVEAARLARITGKPVQVMWTRKEEFFYDTFRPAAIVKIRSGLAGDGRITFWKYDTYFAGPRGLEQFYAIPHQRSESHVHHTGISGAHPFATGPWRAPGNNTNTFARESHIDIMAAKANADPVEFRIKNLTDRRMLNTLKAAAARFGWKSAPGPSGRGYGVACSTDAGACVATMAEVEVNRTDGKVRVKRMVCAQDMGFVVNPEGARIQMEGCLVMGLGYALVEEVNFKGGRIFDENFDTYEIPRFSWLPKIETVLVDNPGLAPQGGGEPPITCVGAVIANAIFDAVGVRMHQMPMTPVRVKEALGK
jgi:nicotinate dehydrogenase subunit B